jgi:D-threo-aldose 1-dehydrogenase
VLSTKAGRLLDPNPSGERPADDMFAVPPTTRRTWDFSRDGIQRSIDDSLTRLGLDRIDIVYLHDCDDHWEQASTEAAATLTDLREQGVIGGWGAGLNQAEMTAEFIRRCDVDVMMLAGRLSLVDPTALREVLPLALERGVGVVAAAVYNSGLLSSPDVPDDARYDYGGAPAELIDRARRIAAICRAHGVTLPEAALAYPLLHPAVVSVVTGMRTAEQVRSNIERHETSLPADLWHELQDAGLIERPGKPS